MVWCFWDGSETNELIRFNLTKTLGFRIIPEKNCGDVMYSYHGYVVYKALIVAKNIVKWVSYGALQDADNF